MLSPSQGGRKGKKTENEEKEEEKEDAEEEEGVGKKRKARGTAKASGRKKSKGRGSGGKGAAQAAKDGGAESSEMLDEKEMKRMLKEQLAQMSPVERAELMEDVNSSDI